MVEKREQILIDIIRDCIRSWSGNYRTRSYRGTVKLREVGWAEWRDGIVIRGKIEGKSLTYDFRQLKRAKTDRVFFVDLESGLYAMGPLESFLRDDDAPCPSSFDFNTKRGDKFYGVWAIPQGVVAMHVKASQPVQDVSQQSTDAVVAQQSIAERKADRLVLKRNVKIQFVKEGIHRYPAAEHDPKLSDVSYLGYPHFHYFYFYVTVEVFHNDRDIEFQQFRRWCESLFQTGVMEIDYKSCEMLAEELINQINSKYPGRDITVEVYEDNINGSVLTYAH